VQDSQKVGFREVMAVWAGAAALTLATLGTYARIESAELYHVSGTGLSGGLGRALVELNYPVALVAIPILLFCADRLGPVALLPLPLCALIPWTVDQDDLDATAWNAIPALGVALAVALTLVALHRGGLGVDGSPVGDRVRIAAALVLVVIAIPWLFVELGFYPPSPIYGEEIIPEDGERLAAVHLGSHHGTEGVLLALTALALSRQLPRFRGRSLSRATGLCLGIMFAYGVGNAVEDFWHEQIVKRGWTDERLPSLILPRLSFAWAVIVVSGVALYALYEARSRSYSSHSDMGT
jgi:hypothetical protein